jgi:hypothetical protein
MEYSRPPVNTLFMENCSLAHLMYLFQGYGYYIYEAQVCFQVWVRYGGTPIPKKLGYGYGGVFFYYIFLYIIMHIFLNICELKNNC